MSSNQHICRTRYTQGRPFVQAKVAIINKMTGKQTTIDKNFKVDTGFDAGIHLSDVHMSDVDIVGVKRTLGTVGLAGGVEKPAHYSLAYLKEIEGYEFPAPGIEAVLILQGSSRHGVLGLEILKRFVTEFNGPNQLLTIK